MQVFRTLIHLFRGQFIRIVMWICASGLSLRLLITYHSKNDKHVADIYKWEKCLFTTRHLDAFS